MPTYISLWNFTDEGIRNIKEARQRAQGTREHAEQLGVKFTAYMTMGPYDIVGLIEAPDDETLARLMLSIGARGTVRTTTMRAFTTEEGERILAGLG